MQTFLPFPEFDRTASVLDRQRLGKQRVETLQILNALSDPDYGWQSHPAVTMWRGYELALIDYGVAICDEWISRGYKDTCRDKILAKRSAFAGGSLEAPWWLPLPKLYLSHRAALYRKAPDSYPAFQTAAALHHEYWWPVPKVS